MEITNSTQNNDLTTPTATLQTSHRLLRRTTTEPAVTVGQVSHLDTGFPIHNSLATLHRSEDGVELNLDTKLPEGAYTSWWVVFNHPEYCEDGCDDADLENPAVNASVFYATGEIVDDEGMVNFNAELLEGILPTGDDQIVLGEDGLVDSFSAEIHPVIRTHGEVIPGQEELQTTTFNGGCPPEGCQDIQFALFPSTLDSQPSLPQFSVGDFALGFDPARTTDTASGLFITDTLNSDTILFDLAHPNSDLTDAELTLAEADLLLSPEWAELLNLDDLQGTDVGDVRIDAQVEAIANPTYQVESGVTSILVDSQLEEVGNFKLANIDSETEPFSEDFQAGFNITDETDFTFSLTDGFTPIDGTIQHEGSLTFDVLPPEITLDFEGDDLAAGTIINDQYDGIGLTISTSSEHDAMLFDTNNQTGDDSDLAASDLGNVLIISEDGDTSDPDDNAQGGTLSFKWDTSVDITGVDLLDIDESGGSITFFDHRDRAMETIEIPELEDNSFQELGLDVESVSRMDILLAGSGAVTAVDFMPSEVKAMSSTNSVIATPTEVL